MIYVFSLSRTPSRVVALLKMDKHTRSIDFLSFHSAMRDEEREGEREVDEHWLLKSIKTYYKWETWEFSIGLGGLTHINIIHSFYPILHEFTNVNESELNRYYINAINFPKYYDTFVKKEDRNEWRTKRKMMSQYETLQIIAAKKPTNDTLHELNHFHSCTVSEIVESTKYAMFIVRQKNIKTIYPI